MIDPSGLWSSYDYYFGNSGYGMYYDYMFDGSAYTGFVDDDLSNYDFTGYQSGSLFNSFSFNPYSNTNIAGYGLDYTDYASAIPSNIDFMGEMPGVSSQMGFTGEQSFGARELDAVEAMNKPSVAPFLASEDGADQALLDAWNNVGEKTQSDGGNAYRDISVNHPNNGGSFGWRTNPITGKLEFHTGNDYSASGGNTYGGISGNVRRARMGSNGEGNFVQVKGKIQGQNVYANSMHNMKNTVTEGQAINRNDIVGVPGSTGNSTGAHIHHEVFTYQTDTAFVRGVISAGVQTYTSGSRIFFEPNGFYQYLDTNGISY